MSKILGSWSGMRKYLEREMLADCLHGRVRYIATSYAEMNNEWCIFKLYIDDELIKKFSYETVYSYFISNGIKPEDYGFEYGWNYGNVDSTPIRSRTEYTDAEFTNALKIYRNQNIHDSLASDDPIVKMFAILDRRIGKRTLESEKGSIDSLPQWLQQIYKLRLQAEHI